MLNRVLRFKREQEQLEREVEAICKDKTIPLEDRWLLFTTSGFGERSTSIEDFDAITRMYGDYNYYDTFGMEKYQTVDMVDLVANMVSDAGYYADNPDLIKQAKKDGEVIINVRQINRLKKEILQRFIRSFIFDW